MSGMVYKSVLRAEIKKLKGKGRTEAFAFFQPILGEPKELETYEGDVEYFGYEEQVHAFVPVQELNYRSEDGLRWGIDYILSYEREPEDGEGDTIYTLAKLNEIGLEMEQKFGIDPETVSVATYSWYTGSDEPIVFE